MEMCSLCLSETFCLLMQVEQMRPDEVRWFYHSHKVKAWKPFVGFDSLNLEKEWRSTNVARRSSEAVCVRGGMFEVRWQNATMIAF